jgi:hypothetical protein
MIAFGERGNQVAKYLLLYRSSVSATDQMAGGSPDDAQAGMDAWMAWMGEAGDAIVDFGSPVAKVSTTGDAGPSTEARPVGGFSILEAPSVDAVTALLTNHPHLHAPDASIEVLEFLPVPGS